MNLYRYLTNSPFKGTDPSGKTMAAEYVILAMLINIASFIPSLIKMRDCLIVIRNSSDLGTTIKVIAHIVAFGLVFLGIVVLFNPIISWTMVFLNVLSCIFNAPTSLKDARSWAEWGASNWLEIQC